MKFKAPYGRGSLLLDGQEFAVKDWTLDVPEDFKNRLLSLGYSVYGMSDDLNVLLPMTAKQIKEVKKKNVLLPMTAKQIKEVKKKNDMIAPQWSTTKRIGIWQITSDHYSGGRIWMYQLAHTLARLGAEVWVNTDRFPIWAENYPVLPNLYYNINGSSRIPHDLDIILTDSKDEMGRLAYEFWLAEKRKPKFVCINFETSNWMDELIPETAKRLKDHRWKYFFCEADLLISCSSLGNKYLLKWLDRDKLVGVINPIVNAYALEKAMTLSYLPFPERPFAVWSSRLSEYKGGDIVYESIMNIQIPFDLVNFGSVSHSKMTGNNLHHVYNYNNRTDAEKYAFMQRANFVLAPSLFEGYGMVPAEALACGTPVIVYDLPVLRENYGNHLIYVPWNDRDAYKRKVMELAKKPKLKTDLSKKFILETHMPGNMEKQIENLPYFSIKRKAITVQMVVFWGPTIVESLESVYPFVEEIIIAYGPTELNRDVAPDNTLELIQNFPDPDKKIILEVKKVWKDKQEKRAWCSNRAKGNYMLILDADEIWIGLDKLKDSDLKFGSPRWIHFWHDMEHWIHGPPNKYFGICLPDYGSAWYHYRWSYWRSSYSWKNHNMPHDASKLGLQDPKPENSALAIPNTSIYHFGYALSKKLMNDKQKYYVKRDDKDNSHRIDIWNNWNGQLGQCEAGVVERVTWELPDIVKRAAVRLGV